jgi:hypothetical protein
MNKYKFCLLFAITFSLVFATKVFASLTFSSDAITGTSDSVLDVGADNNLSLQTTNNGPITTGSGSFTVGGDLTVSGLASSGTQCLHTSSSGLISGTGSDCGGSGAIHQVDSFSGSTFDEKLNNCINSLSAVYGGTCDGRNFTTPQTLSSDITISKANVHIYLPCVTVTTAYQVIVPGGVRNIHLEGCSYQGGSTSSGTAGGTVWLYTGSGNAFQIGDTSYTSNTNGFYMDNVNINTTGAGSNATGIYFARAQEMRLDGIYLNGSGSVSQDGIVLDGTGNYTGGTFIDVVINNFGTGWYLTGHLSGSVSGDFANASTFVKTHVVCPTSGGSPIAGTYGVNVVAGDGNTWDGGDVEGCSTMFHLGTNAINNTVDGLRNENSTIQYQADSGSSYNAVFTGGTLLTGQLIDNGSRNSFWDAFHHDVNGMKGDWYASQQDATLTNHLRLGTGVGNERGLLNEIQTDYGYRWLYGFSDATAGEQFYQIQDLLNNVYRFSIGQLNNGNASTNDQTVVNAAGTGAVVLNGSNNSGTGGVVFGSGGPSETTVATINSAGNALFNGTLNVGGVSTFAGSTIVKNQADAEIDSFLWAGTTANQKESFTYKDYLGASQWFMVKDASNNWALNSATGNIDSFKAYQNTNSGDTYINTSNNTGVIRLNYESGSSSSTNIYAGGSSLIAGFTGTTSIKFPGLASPAGVSNIPRLDSSGYLTNSGVTIGSGTSAPGGSCTAPAIYLNSSGTTAGNNNFYVCSSGSWLAVK